MQNCKLKMDIVESSVHTIERTEFRLRDNKKVDS